MFVFLILVVAASPVVNSMAPKTPKTAPRSKTMSIEEKVNVRANQSMNTIHSNDVAEEFVPSGSLTPRRSTRITAKVAITPSMEMPPPKTVNSTATKRRKTTVTGPSASKKSGTSSDEGSETPSVSSARNARRTLNINVQSDSANESDNTSASQLQPRGRKSKSVRAMKEASVTQNGSEDERESISSKTTNGKFVKAPHFDDDDMEVKQPEALNGKKTPAKGNRSIIVAMAISRHQSETDDFQTAEESDPSPTKLPAGKSKKRNYVSLLPSEAAEAIPAPSSAKSDRKGNNVSLNGVSDEQSKQSEVSDHVEEQSADQKAISDEIIEHTDDTNDMVTVRKRGRKTFAEAPATSPAPRPRRNYASLANGNVPIAISPKLKYSDKKSTYDDLTEDEKILSPKASSNVSLNKSKNTSTVSLNKSNRSQKDSSAAAMTDDEDDVVPEAAISISSNKSNNCMDNISGVAALTEDEDDDEVPELPTKSQNDIPSVAAVNNDNENNDEETTAVQPLSNIPMITVDLTDSIIEESAPPEHVLNVTFSPIAERAEPTTSVMENSLATAFDHSKMRRIASTPKVPNSRPALPLTPMSAKKTPLKRLQAKSPRNSDDIPKAEDSRASGRRGTPYMRKVSHANMASVANTKVFSTAKKEKILTEAQNMVQKRVTFNSSVVAQTNVLGSAMKSANKKGIDGAAGTVSTSGKISNRCGGKVKFICHGFFYG